MDYIKKYRDVTIIMWQLGYHSINPGFEYALCESQKHCSCKGQAKLCESQKHCSCKGQAKLCESQKHCSCKGQAKLLLCYGNFIKANTQIISLIF